ncbi:hypothetical protein L211DRAFT_590871 [Terfezia boudieri ATCC MYA-4762]|uniref:Uncharacterized protein n=1 Tax=Terfezia boudieri ATCC MYA-4762 TaxID=1051890 RepID=A0A3N4LGF7_9PEZI|nr:hypothetical protein L211DRAFT_590871 [Terfezia boudieri ATCC MYA-4762]
MRSPPETREDSEEGKLICQLRRARKIRVKESKAQDPHAVINRQKCQMTPEGLTEVCLSQQNVSQVL